MNVAKIKTSDVIWLKIFGGWEHGPSTRYAKVSVKVIANKNKRCVQEAAKAETMEKGLVPWYYAVLSK